MADHFDNGTETVVFKLTRPNRSLARQATLTWLMKEAGAEPIIAGEEHFNFECSRPQSI